jgi:lyso-ornithine lipid O-acyltransferase
VTVGWRGAEPPERPRLGAAERWRLAWRAPLVLALTLGLFGAFLVLRGIDKAAKAVWRGHLPALAPWVVHLWGWLMVPIAGLRYEAVGRMMEHPGALVANHASWLDIVVLMRATRIFFVSKAEVGGWPGIGTIGRAIGTIFIERRPSEAKRQQAVLLARLSRGDRMVIFPEGTSTDGRRVLPFKSALFGVFFEPALEGRMWVQPVSIVYRAPSGLPAVFYGWWGTMDFGAHLRDVLALSRGGRVEVTFHPPLRAADFDGRKALADRAGAVVRAEVERRLGRAGSVSGSVAGAVSDAVAGAASGAASGAAEG